MASRDALRPFEGPADHLGELTLIAYFALRFPAHPNEEGDRLRADDCLAVILERTRHIPGFHRSERELERKGDRQSMDPVELRLRKNAGPQGSLSLRKKTEKSRLPVADAPKSPRKL